MDNEINLFCGLQDEEIIETGKKSCELKNHQLEKYPVHAIKLLLWCCCWNTKEKWTGGWWRGRSFTRIMPSHASTDDAKQVEKSDWEGWCMRKQESLLLPCQKIWTCLSSSFACHLLIFTSSRYSSLYFSTSAAVRCFWKVLSCWVSFILPNSHSRFLILSFSWLVCESWWLALHCFMNSWVAACAWKRRCTFNHRKEKENSPHLSVAYIQVQGPGLAHRGSCAFSLPWAFKAEPWSYYHKSFHTGWSPN